MKKLPQAISALKEYKERNKLTFQELEQQIGIHGTTLSSWLNGSVRPVSESISKVQLFLDRQYSTEFTKKFSKNVDYIDSRLISKWLGRDHKYLLRDIRTHIEHLTQLDAEYSELGWDQNGHPHKNTDATSIYSPELYFIESSYIHPQNKMELPYFLVTQLGCDLIRNRLNGARGTQFAVLYIDEFHRMKDNEQAKTTDHDRKPAPRLEDDPTFSREAIERRLANMTPEQRDLNYIRNKLIEVSKTDDIRAIMPKLVRVAKLIDIILGTDSEARKLQ